MEVVRMKSRAHQVYSLAAVVTMIIVAAPGVTKGQGVHAPSLRR
jgi:hypothetical protein